MRDYVVAGDILARTELQMPLESALERVSEAYSEWMMHTNESRGDTFLDNLLQILQLHRFELCFQSFQNVKPCKRLL